MFLNISYNCIGYSSLDHIYIYFHLMQHQMSFIVSIHWLNTILAGYAHFQELELHFDSFTEMVGLACPISFAKELFQPLHILHPAQWNGAVWLWWWFISRKHSDKAGRVHAIATDRKVMEYSGDAWRTPELGYLRQPWGCLEQHGPQFYPDWPNARWTAYVFRCAHPPAISQEIGIGSRARGTVLSGSRYVTLATSTFVWCSKWKAQLFDHGICVTYNYH